ncbi:hypothetical protein [Kovacikia minuta]|nr:hypothetical protein [Kovacikia minuta]
MISQLLPAAIAAKMVFLIASPGWQRMRSGEALGHWANPAT